MSPESQDARNRIIEVAADLFLKQGYGQTGIAQILAAAGVLRGSLYYHFPTKEDLLLATLEWRKRMLWPEVITPVFDRVDDPLERLFGILDGYRQMLLVCEFQMGCPIGNLALELSESNPRARQLLAENFENWKNAIRGCLEEAQSQGRLPEDSNANDLAHYVLTVMEGAVMLARTYRTIDTYDRAISLLRDHLDRLQTAATSWGERPRAIPSAPKNPKKS
jgi:TetR/AcrR family transcriptional regulator, transcriptional repressor for nem operon